MTYLVTKQSTSAARQTSGPDICSQNRLRATTREQLHSAHVTPVLYYLLTPTSFRCYFIPLCNYPRSVMSELCKFQTDTTGRNEKLFVHRMNACQPNVNMQAKYLVYYLVCGLRIAVATGVGVGLFAMSPRTKILRRKLSRFFF